jgi:protoporphyrinogen oxidase
MLRASPDHTRKILEDFLINRFGRELYLTFFKSYTEKVWGTPCDEDLRRVGRAAHQGPLASPPPSNTSSRRPSHAAKSPGDIAQKGTDTSLIERFMYPKFGPGQLWEHVADLIVAKRRRDPHGLEGRQINFAPAAPGTPLHVDA